MEKPRVLFLCSRNSARSQMAAAFLKKHAGDRFEVHSAGLEPSEVHPMTVQVMREAGIDISGERAKGVEVYLGKLHFGYLITVCAKAEANCPIFPGVSARLYWPFDDPVEFEGSEAERLAKFRQVRDQVEERVLAWLRRLEAEGPPVEALRGG